jgi:peptide-methionine (S)-S-oxide reductase
VVNDERLMQGDGSMTEIATFGAGCFWGVEAAFQGVPGVIDTAVGYSGGEMPSPTYKDVCTDETGHAEVVQVTFDPAKVSYEKLLDVFWKAHDPTQVNRQGPDFGSQYRTAIFFHSPEQEAIAKKSRAALEASGKFKRAIATEITSANTFYRAEEYHQKYLQKRGAASCHF